MVKQIVTSHKLFLSSPLPFQPSKLTLSLSVCFLALISSQAQATSASQLQSPSPSPSQDTLLNVQTLQPSQRLSNEASRLEANQTDNVVKDTLNSNFANSQLMNNDLNDKQAQIATGDAQLEEALVALKLKQAVERGLIDASVLEDYKRETLNHQNNTNEVVNDASNSNAINNPTSNNAASNNATNAATNSTQNDEVSASNSNSVSDGDLAVPLESSSYQTQKPDNLQDKNTTITPNTDDDFDQAFQDAGFDKGLDVVDIANNGGNLQSPSEIEATLSQIEADIAANLDTQFDAPVAKLDAQTPLLGLDASIQDILPVPSNRETLGINSTDSIDSSIQVANPAANKPLSGFAQTPSIDSLDTAIDAPVTLADDANNSNINNIAATNPVSTQGVGGDQSIDATASQTTSQVNNQTANQATSNITGEQIAQAQKEGDIAAGINPEEYLPEYQGKDMNEATADAISASDAKDDVRAGDGVGFFKGLYNRLFNGGYASLPKIKANIYLQDDTRRDASGQPLLVKADNDTQPVANIEAVLENIAVEAIQDFPSVLPKLREEALNAAQAVGYYDINLQFKREDNNTVAVIITQLGEPIRVNNRLVDIRGEGEDLAQFEAIVEKSPPLPGDVFNHGVYKNVKADIERTTEQFGFFDARWLNSSVDIILPDNTADIDLIYDTQKRYEFGEVVFFTIDSDTGQLTSNPDRLPVAPKLLHQLYDFEQGDKFYQPLVTSFTNDLSATRYFNMVNVEPIRPGIEGEADSNLAFEAVANAGLDAEVLDGEVIDGVDVDTTDTAVNSDSGPLPDSNGNSNNQTASADSDIKPIEFSIDQQTSERLQAVADKAERLTRLPDDRVLDEKEVEAKSFLGKLSNAVSHAFKKILPDEEKDLAVAGLFDPNLNEATLQAHITPQEVAETKQVPLYVFVMADKPKDLSLGLGYGTDTGVRAVARFDNNLINRQGYQAGASLGVSTINQSLSVYGSRPWKHPLDDTLLANLSVERELINQGEGTLDLTSNTIKAGIARKIRSDSGWNRSYSLRYRLDQLESGVDDITRKDLPVPFNRNDAKFTQQALLLGYTLDKTVTDNLINPTKGWHQYYSIEAGADGALTDTNMAIVRAGANGVYSFGEFNKHQVIGRLEGGYIWADSFEDVPYKLRFFAGGDGSIRGYDYNSLSTLENGYLIGGQVLALGSGEYNYEFKPGFRGAVFADVGNAYDTNFDTETKLGVGFGIRWASPVGMVRLDLAAGVLEDSIPVRLHFFIGSPLQ